MDRASAPLTVAIKVLSQGEYTMSYAGNDVIFCQQNLKSFNSSIFGLPKLPPLKSNLLELSIRSALPLVFRNFIRILSEIS